MTSLGRSLAAWPALEGGSLPPRIDHERGVWGKVPGSSSDFRWIAASSAFPRRERIEQQLVLGSEDAPRTATHWRSLGELYVAMATYASPAADAAGRSGFLEKQIFTWRRAAAIPATLGAMALLPRVAQTNAGIWWDRRGSFNGEDPLLLSPQDHAPFAVSLGELEETVETGFSELETTVSEESLAAFYARLIAGHRAVPLDGLAAPLGPEALAALLLPLPRDVADRLSVAGWLPSRRAGVESLQSCWNATLGGEAPVAPATEPTPEHQERGRRLARAIFSRNPAPTSGRPLRSVPAPERRPVQLALWGASAAGKTALLAQLYLANLGNRSNTYDAYPAPASRDFFRNMRDLIRKERKFPSATGLEAEPVEYHFQHRATSRGVSLRLEDRAGSASTSFGSASTDLTEAMNQHRRHLTEANGLILLFDPTAQGDTLYSQVLSTLESLFHERTGKDPRPIAVCLSKADLLIRTEADLQRATENPDDFVRRHDKMGLADLLGHYCTLFRFFPVSAAGVRVRYGLVESVVFYDNELSPRIGPGGSPVNVMEPFAWLLDEVTKAA
ncbi:MAG TPA: hypothetical protein DD490_21555 [Acidobacteria bacterium]|nr:hypothetical protein [Acidobacteriota bacterium]